jgi:hypothetical protein
MQSPVDPVRLAKARIENTATNDRDVNLFGFVLCGRETTRGEHKSEHGNKLDDSCLIQLYSS